MPDSSPPPSRPTELDTQEAFRAHHVGTAWQELCNSNKQTPPEVTVARLHSLAAASIEMAVFLEMERLNRTPTFVVRDHRVGD